ncbi:hypothetical protein MATL_G00220620 [Megalops atlanticus]|uniref:B box-type domain-containing protein n=1 Tax=Megalops atlanticus TaxID=7932 RepID=A0A9D3SWT8_MEGAT|nr:hypothetical protein MATL_G00220620 [Megalops atlanticus]
MSLHSGRLDGAAEYDGAVKAALPETRDDITTPKDRMQWETASPPALSRVPMNCDQSPNRPISSSGNDPEQRVQQEKPPSPTYSYMSTSTMTAMDEPGQFMEDILCDSRIHLERPVSPVPSCLSIRSDWSMAQPINFTGEFAGDPSYPEPGGVACDLCTERKVRAVKSCLTCTASYCETHVRQHYRAAVLQRHTLVEAAGDLEHRLCQQHHRALEFYCETDQTLICSLCTVQGHRGHDVVYDELKQAGTQTPSCS